MMNPNKFSFLYFASTPHHGGFCFYDLLSDKIDCPTDRFEHLKDQTVVSNVVAPDDKYLLFEYDSKGCPVPWCDYFGKSYFAVLNIENGQLLEIGSSSIYYALNEYEMKPWRPKP